MKKLFIIAISLLTIGIGLPVLAASTGNSFVEKKCSGEKALSIPKPANEPRCKKKEQTKKKEEAEREEAEKEEARFMEERARAEAALENRSRAGAEKVKQNSSNTSFNFLYYLFYKSSINEFLKDADYCDAPAIPNNR